MSYDYRTQRANVFTEQGQVMFLKIRDNAKALIAKAGATTFAKIITDVAGDSWDMLACVDRLVELGELLEVPNPHSPMAQHRVFIFGRAA